MVLYFIGMIYSFMGVSIVPWSPTFASSAQPELNNAPDFGRNHDQKAYGNLWVDWFIGGRPLHVGHRACHQRPALRAGRDLQEVQDVARAPAADSQ